MGSLLQRGVPSSQLPPAKFLGEMECGTRRNSKGDSLSTMLYHICPGGETQQRLALRLFIFCSQDQNMLCYNDLFRAMEVRFLVGALVGHAGLRRLFATTEVGDMCLAVQAICSIDEKNSVSI